MNANVLINSFNTGEISGLCESRSDLAKFSSACRTLENAIPLVEGGAKKMPGTYFAGATKNGTTNKARLVPFQFSTDQGAVLEFSDGMVRVWEGAAQGYWYLGIALQPPSMAAYNPVTAYTAGNLVSIGPTAFITSYGGTPAGTLYISAPHGTTNANTVPITITVNTSDALSVTKTGSTPNQGFNIALAMTTAAKNAATLIQAAIRALVSLNASGANFVDLSAWTVTPDSVYYAAPWTTFMEAP